MATVIRLPPLLQLKWCETSAMSGAWPAIDGRPPDALRFEAGRPIEYADPMALAMLGAWGARHRSRSGAVEIDDSLKSPYAWRCGLLSALAGRFGQGTLPADRQLLRRLVHEADIPAFIAELRTLFNLDRVASEAPAYFLSELLRNVFEHSGSLEGAFVAAGYFPKADRLTFAVADLGMTIPEHIRRRWPGQVELRTALAMALEPRVSGSLDTKRNAGLGLYMTRRVTSLMEGRFWLLTGGLLVRDGVPSAVGGTAPPEISTAEGAWPGTCVALSFAPDRIRSFTQELGVVQRELAGGTSAGRDVFRKAAPTGFRVVRVEPDVAGLLEDKLVAARRREEEILPALARGERIALDLGGVTLTTQSCMHALIAEPLRVVGPAEVEQRICFVAAKSQVRDVLRIVMGYALESDAP